MEETVDITGMDKAKVLAALYNRAQPLGMGHLHYKPGDMSVEQAEEILGRRGQYQRYYYDYLIGRVMKVDIGGDSLAIAAYDRDNGEGAARDALQKAGLLGRE